MSGDPQGFTCKNCGHCFGVKKTLLIHEKTCGENGRLVMQAGRWVGAEAAGAKGAAKSGKAGRSGKGGKGSKGKGGKGDKGADKGGKGGMGGQGGAKGKGGKRGGNDGSRPIAERFGIAPAANVAQQRVVTSSPPAEVAPVAAGISKKSESAIRRALQGTRDGADHFVDASAAPFAVGQKVHALYVDQDEGTEEWFDATVWELHEDGSVDVYYDDFEDEWATLKLEQLSAKEAKPKKNGVANGGSTKDQPRESRCEARVPRPAAANPFGKQRVGLPVFEYREQLLRDIEGNQVVIVEGDTGCGKTTQVPQYVLEAACASGAVCSIICTQPRRISAMGVADRVAAERGEALGGTVGYSVRLDSKTSSSTALLFCTTGILMRRLEDSPDLAGVTHVFVDEVHERSMESDFLLMVLRDLVRRRPDMRLVLMSATLNASLFTTYFSTGGLKAPTVCVPGRAFPVTQLFLEDVLEITQHQARSSAEGGGKGKGGKGPKGGGGAGENRQGAHGASGGGAPTDADLTPADLKARYPGSSDAVRAALSRLDPDAINYDLIVQLLQWLCSSACEDGPAAVARWAEAKRSGRRASQSVSAGYSAPAAAKVGEQAKQMKGGAGTEALENAVLIFLPGVKEIQTLHEAILATREFRSEPQRSWVLPLHGMLPPDEQRWVFDRAPPGVRKVVIATNIAETAITVDDVSIVIDCGRMKEKRFDPAKRMESLEDVLVSRANAKQRRGRAGRTRPGVAFHLITSFAHDKVIDSFQPPEISRVPLERLVLTIKSLRYVEPASEVCARLLEPPKLVAVKRAVRELVELDALDVGDGGEKLTALGVHLSTLPVDVRIGKLILLGTIFGVVDETLTIAAALSYRSPFLSPFDQRDAADAAKRSFTVGQSDHLAVLKAYTEFDQTSGQAKFEFAREHFLGIKTLQSIAGLKRQLLELLSHAHFVAPGLRARAVEAMGRRAGGSDGVRLALGAEDGDALADRGALLKALLCAALYPQVVVVEQAEPAALGGKAGKSGKAGKMGGGGAPKFTIREDDKAQPVTVMLHPSSVNARETKFESKYLVYAEKVRTTQVYVRDCAPVSAYALMLFGGALSSDRRRRNRDGGAASAPAGYQAYEKDGNAPAKVGGRAVSGQKEASGESILSIDSWIKFSVPKRIEELVFEVRDQLDGLLQHKIANPRLELSRTGKGILDAVKALLASTPPK